MTNKDVTVRRENAPRGMLDVMPEFENMVERFFGSRFSPLVGEWPAARQRVTTRIEEAKDHYVLSAEIPGIPVEEVDINVVGNLMTIRAEHKEQEEGSKKTFRREYRSFQQSFALPTSVDPEKIEAHYENGVLEVLLPKVEQAKPKKIQIQSGKTTPAEQTTQSH